MMLQEDYQWVEVAVEATKALGELTDLWDVLQVDLGMWVGLPIPGDPGYGSEAAQAAEQEVMERIRQRESAVYSALRLEGWWECCTPSGVWFWSREGDTLEF